MKIDDIMRAYLVDIYLHTLENEWMMDRNFASQVEELPFSLTLKQLGVLVQISVEYKRSRPIKDFRIEKNINRSSKFLYDMESSGLIKSETDTKEYNEVESGVRAKIWSFGDVVMTPFLKMYKAEYSNRKKDVEERKALAVERDKQLSALIKRMKKISRLESSS